MSKIKTQKILAIETSCDETAMAFVEASGEQKNPKFKVLANLIASQINVHRPFGGVVPNLAKREHLKNLPILYQQLWQKLNHFHDRINGLVFDYIAVTVGPGLDPALWTGVEFAKTLAKKIKKPLVGVNHLEGHVYSNWLPKNSASKVKSPVKFPAVCLVASGGHTILLLMKSMKQWKKLGGTRDDAVGEAFDKVARMLKLAYPGGPEVEKLAKKSRADAISFPRPMIYDKSYDFSFSGLKTSVLYYLRDHKKVSKANVCASFQQAAVDVLVHKTTRAAKEFGAKSVLLCGGVAANKALQKELGSVCKKNKLNLFVPEFIYNTDNAVMIAAAAYLGNHYPTTKPLPNLNL